MSISLPNTIWLKLVSDASTPSELLPYAGVRILLTEAQAATFPQPGVHDFFLVLGAQVYGYIRSAQSGDGYEWVMEATPEPIVVAVQGIPGGSGWTNEAAGAIYVTIGRALLAQGFSVSEAAYGLKQLYDAARADV